MRAAPQVVAELHSNPVEAVIGEPLEWTLRVRHPVDVKVSLENDDALARLAEIERLSWAVIDGPRVEVVRTSATETLTSFRWRVLSLEGGKRGLPEMLVRTENGTVAAAPAGEIQIWGELAQGEDAPRDTAGLHDIELAPARLSAFQVAGGSLALVLLLVLVLVFLRRARRARVESPPTPAERLAALRAALPNTPEEVREFAFVLSHALRQAVEQQLGGSFEGLTHEEWLARARSQSGVAADVIGELQGLLVALVPLKYSREVPTRFRVEELLTTAEGLVRHIVEAPVVAPAGEAA